MGADPPDGAVPWKFPTQGRAMAHWEAAEEMGGWELVIPTFGGGNGGIMLQGDWEIHHEES